MTDYKLSVLNSESLKSKMLQNLTHQDTYGKFHTDLILQAWELIVQDCFQGPDRKELGG